MRDLEGEGAVYKGEPRGGAGHIPGLQGDGKGEVSIEKEWEITCGGDWWRKEGLEKRERGRERNFFLHMGVLQHHCQLYSM